MTSRHGPARLYGQKNAVRADGSGRPPALRRRNASAQHSAGHGAWWFLAGLHDWVNPGKKGSEEADEINDYARPWLEEHAAEEDWFLHVNY